MKEIKDILSAYAKATKDGLRAALATVVKVEGSSYRRPGARMLITEDGNLTGAISGGCLEGDALRKALSAIHQQQNKLVTYDTTDEDDAKLGVQLGCNGIVYILFEPIKSDLETNPISLLTALEAKRENAVLATLFSLSGTQQIGTALLYKENLLINSLPAALNDQIIQDAQEVLFAETSFFKTYNFEKHSLDVFLEFIPPPIALIIAGAGNDAQPLAEMASRLGWEVTVADGRPTHATATRFPTANRVLISKADQLLSQISIDEQTAFVLMTHNYNYDLGLLKSLLPTSAVYIGTLGPKKKLVRMLEEIGAYHEENETRIHGPIGLDIGAETAEEIAIAILAEIKSVFTGAAAGSLKDKNAPIHEHDYRN